MVFFTASSRVSKLLIHHTPICAGPSCSWKLAVTDAEFLRTVLTRDLGYFVWNHATLAGLQSVFAQAWKEYALSDSRYLTSDVFMLCVESITVVSIQSPHPLSWLPRLASLTMYRWSGALCAGPS